MSHIDGLSSQLFENTFEIYGTCLLRLTKKVQLQQLSENWYQTAA